MSLETRFYTTWAVLFIVVHDIYWIPEAARLEREWRRPPDRIRVFCHILSCPEATYQLTNLLCLTLTIARFRKHSRLCVLSFLSISSAQYSGSLSCYMRQRNVKLTAEQSDELRFESQPTEIKIKLEESPPNSPRVADDRSSDVNPQAAKSGGSEGTISNHRSRSRGA